MHNKNSKRLDWHHYAAIFIFSDFFSSLAISAFSGSALAPILFIGLMWLWVYYETLVVVIQNRKDK